ncbi:MAG: sigma 54-interacting transcriptional regulator [Clostridia bacterium]|nr:sigma 54-interacting transcriptional regulator [Clostridia bacterium]
MAKAAILMPYPDLKDLFDSLIEHYPRLLPMTVEYVETDRVAERAVFLANEGCELFIARGLQARLIRAAVEVPVIEMRASTQELESLVLALKQKTRPAPGEKPRLGIIGFFNMFHSTERFNSLLDVDLKVYTATDIEQYGLLVNQAVADGCRGVIGGEFVLKQAAVHALPSCFLSMGEESAREALESASLVGYSIDLHKRSAAEINAMLDHTPYALAQVDETGAIRLVNRLFLSLAGKSPRDLIGRPILDIVDDLSPVELRDALENSREIESSVVTLGHRKALLNITPVLVESHISGAILTFQESQRVSEMDTTLRKDAARRGQGARYTFDHIFAENPAFQHTIGQLKRLSRFRVPVLLQGESGTGKGILAECIHNESLNREGAFVALDCGSTHPDDLDEKLFGRYSSRKEGDLSAVETARGGTLYLRQVDRLTPETQFKVLQLAHGQYCSNGSSLSIPVDLKLILTTEVNLQQKVAEGSFLKDLYYTLNALRIFIPPLRSRREDIPAWFHALLHDRCRALGRQVYLAPEALQTLSAYPWPGNLDEMISLCDRLILLSEKRTVEEDILLQHLQAISSESPSEDAAGDAAILNPRAQELLNLLNRHHGNREKAAAELGVSKTTLWRRMKKYGIARDLSLE